MKKSPFIITLLISILVGTGIFWGFSKTRLSKEERSRMVNTRIDNIHQWTRWAEQGLVSFNQDIKAAPATFTGSRIFSPDVVTDDSPDVPVTTINSTQSENSIFADPSDSDVILNSNNSTQNPVGNLYGANDLFSLNAGEVWEGEVEGAGGDNWGDPTTAIGLNGRWYVNYIDNSGGMGLSYSDNQGGSWNTVTIAPNPGDLADKNHMWIDNSPSSPYEGNLYVGWTAFGGSNNNEIVVSVSTNDGLSWTSPTPVSQAVAAGSHNQGVNLSVGPNGEVYAIWAIYDGWPTDETAIGMARSLDGGQSWDPAQRIISNIRGIRNSTTSKNMRVNSFPCSTADISTGGYSGRLYVTWANVGFPGVNAGPDIDVYMIWSDDQGGLWSDPVRINQDASGQGKEHYMPWITSDPSNGNLSAVFYDDRSTSSDAAEVYCANSADGGITWEDFKVSDVSFIPSPIPGLASSYFGDYLGITAQDGWVYPVWTDNRSGSAMTYCSPYQLNPLNKPGNLDITLTFESGNCNLIWTYEEQEGFEYFMVYREGELLGTTTDSTFTDVLPDYGDYQYGVSAFYTGDLESGQARGNVRWGDAHIFVSPAEVYVHLTVDSSTTRQVQVVNVGELPLSYTISPLVLNKGKDRPVYCDAEGGGTDEYISRVVVGSINNATGQTNYGDYTNLSTLMNVGDSYPITVTNGDPVWSTDECLAWADWNQNGEFESSEAIAFNGSPGVGPYTANIEPPVGAISGRTRLRVRINYNATPPPCGTTSWGEVEDYSIDVQGWLAIDPLEGEVMPGDTSYVNIDFDATDLEPGSYFGQMNVYNNDPDSPEVIIPLQMDVDQLLVSAGTESGLTSVCNGDVLQLTSTVYGQADTIIYNWYSSPEGFVSDQPSASVSPMENTWFFIEVTGNGYTALDSVYIEVIDYPVVELGADSLYCGDQVITLSAYNEGATYLWNTGDTTSSIDVDSLTLFSGYGVRNIEVMVTRNNLCQSGDNIALDFVDCTGVEEHLMSEVVLYPNPSAGMVTLTFSVKSNNNWQVHAYDNTGKLVYNHEEINVTPGQQLLEMDFSFLDSGHYIITLDMDGQHISQQLIIK